MTEPERRANALERRTLLPRDGGRRATDPQPSHGTRKEPMPDTPRIDLAKLADVASTQGRPKVAAVCFAALAYIDTLEQEVRRVRGNAVKGAQTRLLRLSATERSLIARRAAQRRWSQPHA